jgi:hypothetical protein
MMCDWYHFKHDYTPKLLALLRFQRAHGHYNNVTVTHIKITHALCSIVLLTAVLAAFSANHYFLQTSESKRLPLFLHFYHSPP